MLQVEHSAILTICIKLPVVIKICVLFHFGWLPKAGFTVHYQVTFEWHSGCASETSGKVSFSMILLHIYNQIIRWFNCFDMPCCKTFCWQFCDSISIVFPVIFQHLAWLFSWVKVFRIIPEFMILRLTFHWKSASKCWIRQIIITSLI